MKIFISHSSKDATIANELCEYLEKNMHNCFIAPRDIRPGHDYASEIVDGVDSSNVMLLLLSNYSNNSPHVLREIERAVGLNIPILVYKLEEVTLSKSLEYFIMTHQWINTSQNEYSVVLQSINDLDNPTPNNNQVTRKVVSSNNSLESKSHKGDDSKELKKVFFPLSIIVLITAIAVLSLVISNIWSKPSSSEDKNNTEETITDSNVDSDLSKIKVGDIVSFGSYYDEPIDWYVISIEKTHGHATLVAKNVLTFKGFDAAESGNYNWDGNTCYYSIEDKTGGDLTLQAHIRGDSTWATSTLRQWLNSDEVEIKYEGQAPTALSFTDGHNAYSTEPGFLYGFSKEEKDSIIVSEITTPGNALSKEDIIITSDKVFLITEEELTLLEECGFSKYAIPTQKAIDNDESKYYINYCLDRNIETTAYWLRTPDTKKSSKCMVLSTHADDKMVVCDAGVSYCGVRPAIIVDLNADTLILR